MLFTFKIGSQGPFADIVSVELNTNGNYGEFVQALQIIRNVIDAKISEYQGELDKQAILRQEEMDEECLDTIEG
jgi:predicted ester cyclase